jgi:hypothetical protein
LVPAPDVLLHRLVHDFVEEFASNLESKTRAGLNNSILYGLITYLHFVKAALLLGEDCANFKNQEQK